MSHAPTLSNNSASMLFTCFINLFLVEIGVDIPKSNIDAESPTKNTLPAMLH